MKFTAQVEHGFKKNDVKQLRKAFNSDLKDIAEENAVLRKRGPDGQQLYNKLTKLQVQAADQWYKLKATCMQFRKLDEEEREYQTETQLMEQTYQQDFQTFQSSVTRFNEQCHQWGLDSQLLAIPEDLTYEPSLKRKRLELPDIFGGTEHDAPVEESLLQIELAIWGDLPSKT